MYADRDTGAKIIGDVLTRQGVDLYAEGCEVSPVEILDALYEVGWRKILGPEDLDWYDEPKPVPNPREDNT